MTALSLQWNMGNAGSADLVFQHAAESVEVHTTYIGDGLGSIVQAAVDLHRGSRSAFAYLPAEPSGTCLFFGGARTDVYVQIVQFADMESLSARWSGGELRWHGRVDVREYVRNVKHMADDVLLQCGGVESYARAWGGISFPIEELESLRQGPSTGPGSAR
ncbi:hypothetical protein K3N28_01465 [Glycomyces sp. TRM65418]|uniref:hypothetical protein n=1 Tax=Glycomyces sp. TRM65418 TaxID=2867006 RepID=UPI001CE6F82B|nr:hypothetical protein [Glycomyces sp. TRM65418]MCC3761741.1 hypothetical protein [Glycomyces sp. TRM65418]QZD55826.1 hypothetical protein K3N28_01455 [Glycomyces sp. TRM65418]